MRWSHGDVGKLFRQLADHSRLHLATSRARSGFRDIPAMKPGDFVWQRFESPETAAIWAVDPLIGGEQALEIALDAETAGLEYYKNILDTTGDPEIKVLATEFVAELHKWIAVHKAGEALPVDRLSPRTSNRVRPISSRSGLKHCFEHFAIVARNRHIDRLRGRNISAMKSFVWEAIS
jgi:hypothetical protein